MNCRKCGGPGGTGADEQCSKCWVGTAEDDAPSGADGASRLCAKIIAGLAMDKGKKQASHSPCSECGLGSSGSGSPLHHAQWCSVAAKQEVPAAASPPARDSEPVRIVPPGGWSCGKCYPSTQNRDTSTCVACGLVLLGHHDEQHKEAHAICECRADACPQCGHTAQSIAGGHMETCPLRGNGKPSAVDHPAHYKAGGLEAIDVIEALGHGHGFCVGNAIKYLWRAGKKTPDVLADLRKARWYVDRAIAALEKGGG